MAQKISVRKSIAYEYSEMFHNCFKKEKKETYTENSFYNPVVYLSLLKTFLPPKIFKINPNFYI